MDAELNRLLLSSARMFSECTELSVNARMWSVSTVTAVGEAAF